MKAVEAQSIRIETSPDEAVSALLIQPPQSRACYVFAHGAGAGMTHASMETVAAGLKERGIATLRYQFPASGPMRPRSPTPRCERRWRKPGDAVPRCR
jgi:predicted alpha/beta-hydrolase family hydrolase